MISVSGCAIYTDQQWKKGGTLVCENGKIKSIGPSTENEPIRTYHFPKTYKCIPGMIDMHIHGAKGADTMDATPETLHTIAGSLPTEGTTAFLATTITQSNEAIERALSNAADVKGKQRPDEAELIGVHLEGPFINKEKSGAQPPEYIAKPDIQTIDRWQERSGHTIREVTLAPEIEGAIDLIRHLADRGIVASLGHSNGSDEDVTRAAAAGASQVTHLFNGMRGMHHRDPGFACGALLNDDLYTELIVDGRHIAPGMVGLAYKLKGSGHLILITDSMRAKGMADGVYDLGGQNVRVNGSLATLPDGTIAGSVLKMNEAIKNMLAFTDAGLEDIVQMGAVNPAVQCGVFARKGSLEVGKDADFIVLDDMNELAMTVCRGTVAYLRKEPSDQ